MRIETSEQDQTIASKNPPIEADKPWKNILGCYFRSFMEFFFPSIAEQINWEREPESLDKELNKAVRDSETGDRVADKLIKLWLKTGQAMGFLVHLEVQGYFPTLPKRMYVYRYRLNDYYQLPIVSVAILIDDHKNWRPAQYRENFLGCSVDFHFLVIKLWDYRDKKPELEASDNPFAIVILAQLAVLETRQDPYSRLQVKVKLTRKLYERGWSKKQVLDFYIFIDWLLTLPRELMLEYNEAMHQLEEEHQVEYVSTAELIGHEKGLAQGLEQGLEKGFQNGEATILIRLLTLRFGTLSDYCKQHIQQADANTLLLWTDKIFTASKLEEIFTE